MSDTDVLVLSLVLLLLVAATTAGMAVGRRQARTPATGGSPGGSEPLAGVAARLGEMGAALQALHDTVGRVEVDRAAEHAELRVRLERAADTNADLTAATSALSGLLLNPTARGAWGERAAGDLLARAGLVEGVSFRRQRVLSDGARPDFTFLLPGGRELHMDVKFPADNYMRSIESTDEAERRRCEAQFLKDVRGCITTLSRRGYTGHPAALGHVLLFIPNEAIHQFLHESDPQLLGWALDRDVILCAPSSLLGVVGVVRESAVAYQREKRSSEILQVLAGVEAQWAKLEAQLDSVVTALGRLDRAVDDLAGPRRRAIQRQLDRVGDLVNDGAAADSYPSDEASLPDDRRLPLPMTSTGA